MSIDKQGIDDLNRLNYLRRYQSTLSLVLFMAVRKEFPRYRLRIEHSMSQGFYCYLDRPLALKQVELLKLRMRQIVQQDLPIENFTMPAVQAARLFREQGSIDKIELLRDCPVKTLRMSKLVALYDAFCMPPLDSTGKVRLFDIRLFKPGFVLLFPFWQDLSAMAPYIPQPKLAKIFNEYGEWVNILGVADVADLNRAVKVSRGSEIIKVSEALHEKKIVYVADRITREKRKIVLIAGPSSAGKTTFTKRLAIQLLVNELKPKIISVDNYFFPHNRTPRDEYGQLDFESIKTVDIALLNRHLEAVIRHREVKMPRFNFIKGVRESGDTMFLPDNGVLLVEGIHCLNEELTYRIPRRVKFKIYISALTQLNIDDHNRISTTDTRMIRRLARDTHYRGYLPQGVLGRWGKVRRGEERNIYPFQEEADEMFNSALIYEPSVLKEYCMPILKKIHTGDPTYPEARRLLNYFAFFYHLPDRDVPSNSILREFIGGSSFVY
jgi:uridine kinase